MLQLCWNDCVEFCKWLSEKEGREYRLPTEAQWEYACRAGTTTPWHFGGVDDVDRLGSQYAIWSDTGQKFAVPQAVGQRKPNAWGVCDMHGGVWEWCADRYDPDYYMDSSLKDPAGPESGRFRVLRGGSWFRYAKYARSAYRRPFHPEGDGDGVTAWILDFGCRPVINLP